MYRLLIVDDEPVIVDNLYEFLKEMQHPELDIYKAYSAIEALNWLNRTKIDIVVSDIRMPGMTGVELLKQIHLYWPRCKVIFLTGFNDFSYVHNAIRNDAVDYILKTEGDDVVLKAIENAVMQIEKEQRDEMLVYKARERMHLAIPLLQQEYLHNLLQGEKSPGSTRNRRFSELEIDLNAGFPVLLMIGRVDCWPDNLENLEKTKLLCEIQSIVDNYLSEAARTKPVICERSMLSWLIQPGDESVPWARLIVFVKESLENIQKTCKELLKLSVSFVLSSEPSYWEKIGLKFDALKLILNRGLGFGNEMLLMDNTFSEDKSILLNNSNPDLRKARTHLENAELMEIYLESGQKQEFWEMFFKLVNSNNINVSKYYNLTMEIYYSIALMFLSYLNRWGLMEEISSKVDLSRLARIDEHQSWEEAVNYFQRLASVIFEAKSSDVEKRTNEVIDRIHQYINGHLHEDLSLVKLSEQVFLNPYYLSRFYKNITGKNLSNYINEARLEKARELLKKNNMKIHEIAATIGHESAPYFTRFFKKEMDMTPQEYRDSFNS